MAMATSWRFTITAGGAETMRRGDFDDADYSVEADVYCEYRPDVAANGYERYGIFARDDGTGAFDLSGTSYGSADCYALTFDSDTGRIRAGKFVDGALTDFLEPTPLVMAATAWREFRIECDADNIRYYVDDGEIANVTDTTFAHGCFGIGYRERFSNNANIHGARADNFSATSIRPDATGRPSSSNPATPPERPRPHPPTPSPAPGATARPRAQSRALPGTGSRFTSYDLPVPGTDNATFVPNVITPARYEVWVTWGLGANCYDAQYTVQHHHGQTPLLVDQDPDENANTWVSLGQYWFATGQSGSTCSVNVSEETVSGKPSETWHQRVYADALMLTFVEWWPNGDYKRGRRRRLDRLRRTPRLPHRPWRQLRSSGVPGIRLRPGHRRGPRGLRPVPAGV